MVRRNPPLGFLARVLHAVPLPQSRSREGFPPGRLEIEGGSSLFRWMWGAFVSERRLEAHDFVFLFFSQMFLRFVFLKARGGGVRVVG